jgi:hypothetical protein
MRNEEKAFISGYLGYTALILTMIAGWITHVVVCIQNEQIGFLIAGAVAAPVGAIHGIGLWFGWW